jgi:hypothetical protein
MANDADRKTANHRIENDVERLHTAKDADHKAANHRTVDNVKKLSSASIREVSNTMHVNNDDGR